MRQYLIRLDAASVDGDPLTDPAARDGVVRDYRAHLQTVAGRKPSTVHTVLAAIGDFYVRLGPGAPDVRRLDLPKQAPRAPSERDVKRWLRTVEAWPSTRDRVLAQIPFYAGLRLGEVVALDVGTYGCPPAGPDRGALRQGREVPRGPGPRARPAAHRPGRLDRPRTTRSRVGSGRVGSRTPARAR